jgi:hypothetical protein
MNSNNSPCLSSLTLASDKKNWEQIAVAQMQEDEGWLKEIK